MEVIQLPLSSIRPYENNPRWNDETVDAVAKSIHEFGFRQPIVIDRDGVIVAGHTRYRAAQQLGLETVPCIRADDLSPDKIRAYRLADNRTAELSSWDAEALAQELDALMEEGIDISATGFSEDEIAELQSRMTDEEVEEYLGEIRQEEEPQDEEPGQENTRQYRHGTEEIQKKGDERAATVQKILPVQATDPDTEEYRQATTGKQEIPGTRCRCPHCGGWIVVPDK